ncbi:hypothetical protein DVH05_000283 [Phytophthora capsici]|nr:hypothetical protein DVH05_000282 [Phytophthora capsici]KAG1712540.1 hypothetical protein DVH05_000283 [Phytophthora capsici]
MDVRADHLGNGRQVSSRRGSPIWKTSNIWTNDQRESVGIMRVTSAAEWHQNLWRADGVEDDAGELTASWKADLEMKV